MFNKKGTDMTSKSRKAMIIPALLLLGQLLLFSNTGLYSKGTAVKQGEVLEYKVSYFGISLATIKVVTESNKSLYGRTRHKVKAYVNTLSHVPMVDVSAIFQSWFDVRYGYSVKFSRNLKIKDKPWEYQEIKFQYDKKTIDNSKWVKKKRMHHSTRKLKGNQRLYDPMALFFKVRSMVRKRDKTSVHTMMDNNPFYTRVSISGKKEEIEVDAFNYPIRTVFVKANAKWEAGYGISGEVEGWFTDDDAGIPVLAKVDFIVGKITIELVKCKRSRWKPPKWR